MIGAIYLDQGYDFVNRLLINHIFVKYIKVDNLLVEETDFKSRLIEWCQKNHHSIQFHTANDKTYSSSHPFFYSKVLIDGIEVGYGAGDSKKEAEQRASYSVSQGFSEADYTKIMDKLDTLDGATKPRERREKEPKVVKSANEVKEVNEIKEVKEPKVKTKSKTAAKTEQKTEPKPESKPEPKVEQKAEQKSESEAEIKVEAKAEKKPRRRRPSKGVAEKSQKESATQKEQEVSVVEKPQEESATPAETVVESVPAEDTPKAKPKSRRRATPKKPKAEGVVTEQKVENQEAV